MFSIKVARGRTRSSSVRNSRGSAGSEEEPASIFVLSSELSNFGFAHRQRLPAAFLWCEFPSSCNLYACFPFPSLLPVFPLSMASLSSPALDAVEQAVVDGPNSPFIDHTSVSQSSLSSGTGVRSTESYLHRLLSPIVSASVSTRKAAQINRHDVGPDQSAETRRRLVWLVSALTLATTPLNTVEGLVALNLQTKAQIVVLCCVSLPLAAVLVTQQLMRVDVGDRARCANQATSRPCCRHTASNEARLVAQTKQALCQFPPPEKAKARCGTCDL